MKFIYTVIVVCFLTTQSFAQISPDLKTGFGYTYVLDKDESTAPDYHTITGYPTFSVEKPFPIEINLKKRLSINPGLAYYIFKEHEINGDTIEGKDYKVNHQTLNGYIKLLYQAKLDRSSEAFVYFGGIGGFHLITKTKGDKITYGLNQEMPLIEVEENENASAFFGMFYYGGVLGFQPNARKYNFIKPSFEITYLPNFVYKRNPELKTDNDDEIAQITYKGLGTIQFTLYLGFRIK